jgi:hypothetical protein
MAEAVREELDLVVRTEGLDEGRRRSDAFASSLHKFPLVRREHSRPARGGFLPVLFRGIAASKQTLPPRPIASYCDTTKSCCLALVDDPQSIDNRAHALGE